MKELLKSIIPSLTVKEADRFEIYYQMLIDWNFRINLTAITEKEDVAKKHFLDSLSALPLLSENASVIDIGTGAGFPGIPLLIMRPDLKVTLVDSLQKRIVFLKEVLQALDLSASCVHSRAEDIGRNPSYRGTFDYSVSRAVAPLPVLVELTIPLIKTGGKSICYKGNAAEELDSAKSALHLLHASAVCKEIPSDYGVRSLVICTKYAPTPSLYPRKAGTPSKNPL